MASDTFCRELHQEAKGWREEGLISSEQYLTLAQRYQFEDLDTAARDRFVMILLGLGSLLVGIGAITFVAANWQALSQTVKAGIMFTGMVIANLSGFALTSPTTPNHRWRRLGQALLLLGALLLGANLALMGQIVHTSGTRYELCAAWAIGILMTAYGMRLAFLGMLSLLILGIGYWSALWDMVWLQTSVLGVWTLQVMALLVTALFLPLAYYCCSQALFALSAIATTSALAVLIVDIGRFLPAPVEASMIVMPYALLWAYNDTVWQRLKHRVQRLSPGSQANADTAADASEQSFQPIARGLMVFALSVFYWVLSFQDVWSATNRRAFFSSVLQWPDAWLIILTLLVFSLGTVIFWAYLGWRPGRRWRLDSLSTTLLVFLVLTAGLLWGSFVAGPIPILATTAFNVLLALTALGMMREGLASGTRVPFWWGLVMLVLQILSRVLEYETGLLIKSLVFVLCGVSVILMGLWFERYVRTLRVDSV